MKKFIKTTSAVAVSVVMVSGLSACGSDPSTEATSTPSSTNAQPTNPAAGPTAPVPGAPASASPAPGAAPATPHYYTIPDFVRDTGLVETQLHPGNPGAPNITLPIPPGWDDAGSRTPEWAWSAFYLPDPAMAADPPNFLTLVSKLAGSGAARVLSYAPGELKNMTDFDGPEGAPLKVGGFNAFQRGGTYTRADGVRRAIVQTTVEIPAPDGVLIMQHNADGLPDQLGLLTDTTRIVNEQTGIVPPG